MGASASRDADDADDADDDSPVYVAPACARERHWLLGTDGDAADIARALNDGGTRAADVLRAVRARCGDEGARHFARTHIVTDWDGPDWVLDATVDGEALLDARVATLALTSTSGEDARPRLIGSCFDDKDKEDGVVVEKASSSRTIMTPMLSYRLARELPKDRVREWRLAFDSDRHGASFRGAMLSRCQDIGPLIILIEPKNLHNTSSSDSDGEREVFVAHASPGLGAPRHDFGGDDFTRCWRFTPREGLVDIGSGTSAPTLYCASGFTQYLNGLGFLAASGGTVYSSTSTSNLDTSRMARDNSKYVALKFGRSPHANASKPARIKTSSTRTRRRKLRSSRSSPHRASTAKRETPLGPEVRTSLRDTH